jgi:MFS transporter, PPP family, 3-phenylpropionic acid transporter
LGFGLLAISVLTSVQAATRLFAPYGWGAVSDRTGDRIKLMRYCACIAWLASLCLWLPLGLWALMAVLLVMFAHTSPMMPMSDAVMGGLFSRSGSFDARQYGRVRVWGSIGFLATVFAAGAWFEQFGMHHFPAWSTLTMLGVLFSVWALPNADKSVAVDTAAAPALPVLRQAQVRWFFATAFFHVLSHIGIYVFFSLYLDELGYSKSAIGMMWAVAVGVEIVWFYCQGHWLARLSLPAWLVLCACAMAVRLGLTAFAGSSLLVLVFAQALHAMSFAAHHTVSVALVSQYFPGRLQGRGQALYSVIGYGLTGVLGGPVGGWISAKYGLTAVYWASLAISCIAILCARRVWSLNQSGRGMA